MTTIRLFVDSHGTGWAMVQCPSCQVVANHFALDAFERHIKCKCGEVIDARGKLVLAIQDNPRAPRELRAAASGFAGHSFGLGLRS